MKSNILKGLVERIVEEWNYSADFNVDLSNR